MEIARDQQGPAADRHLAIVDKNRDLYRSMVRNFGKPVKIYKLGGCS